MGKFVVPLFLLLASTHALPQGAPTSACQTLTPFHGGGILPQRTLSPYSVFTTRRGGQILVQVTSTLGVKFQGFMVQARTPSSDVIGEFDGQSTDLGHLIDCSESGDTITHNNPTEIGTLEVMWRPPEGFDGHVIFNATVLQGYDTFWTGVTSDLLDLSHRHHGEEERPARPRAPPTARPPAYAPPPPRAAAAAPDPFYAGCGDTKLCFGAPGGCVATRSCRAAVAVTVAGDQYEFEMRAGGGAAWVGAGLSADQRMGEDSVVECARRGGSVAAYMSWTSGAPNYGAARLSNPQLGIQLHNGSFVDGVLYCRVRRDAVTNVNGKVFDLVNDRYNLLVASGSSLKPQSVGFHDLAFLASEEQLSLSDVSDVAGASKLLIRLHGAFMIAAWVGTASVGILLARYFRQTWVGTQLCGKDVWFAWHRIFMVLTWALTIAGFVLIFVELKAWSGENNPHAILGTITTFLCFIQPIGAYFRPHPGTRKRPIFNWAHWFIGNAAHIVAIVTLFFAVKLTKAELPDFVDWILTAYVAFHVVTHLVLSVMGCISEKSSESRVTSFPMKDLGGSGRNSAYADRSVDAPFSAFRRFMLALYIVIVLGLVIALIVITALAPIEETWSSLKSSVMTNN